MRIKKYEIKCYQFDELSEETKEKVIEEMWDINVNYEWWDSTYEDAKNVGIKIISFDIDRGSYCNGDIVDAKETAQKIQLEHGADCETFKTACAFIIDMGKVDDDDIARDETIAEFKWSILEDYRIILRNVYEYSTSEECIIETIKINEFEFDIEGNIV